MSALGQKQTYEVQNGMSVLLPKRHRIDHALRHFRSALRHRARCLPSSELAVSRPRDERALVALGVPLPLEAMDHCLSASSWALSSISSTFSVSRSIFS